MLGRDEIYRIWAPPESLWSRWAKPVLFAFLELPSDEDSSPTFTLTDFSWVPSALMRTAIVVDLPGAEGVFVAIELAQRGYRPVPLYNALPYPPGTPSHSPLPQPRPLVNLRTILTALHRAAPVLEKMALAAAAPPVFLLDAARREKIVNPTVGDFDNRSVTFTTDFPSAQFLKDHGIERAIVVQHGCKPQTDLLQILVGWQESGISLSCKDAHTDLTLQPLRLKPPNFLQRFWYYLQTGFLKKNELGAFGGIIPPPSGG